MMFSNFYTFIIVILLFISFINCEEVSLNKVNLIISSFQNNVLKNYEEVLELKNNGTVSRFNVLYGIKKFTMNLHKKSLERNIEKLKLSKEKNSLKINEPKLVEEISYKEKLFLNEYQQLLKIVKDTNELYLHFMKALKKICMIIFYVIIFLTLIVIGITIYITSPTCRKYNRLIEEKDESDKNAKNDSTIYRGVKIVNNFMGSEKKIK